MTTVDPRTLVREMAAAALNAQADLAQERTRDMAPRDSGGLEESILTDHATAGNLVAQVYTGAEYAIFQHEAISLEHEKGRSKFMEAAVTGASIRGLAKAAGDAVQRMPG